MANSCFHSSATWIDSGWTYYDYIDFDILLNDVIYGQGYDETCFPLSTKRDYVQDMREALEVKRQLDYKEWRL